MLLQSGLIANVKLHFYNNGIISVKNSPILNSKPPVQSSEELYNFLQLYKHTVHLLEQIYSVSYSIIIACIL